MGLDALAKYVVRTRFGDALSYAVGKQTHVAPRTSKCYVPTAVEMKKLCGVLVWATAGRALFGNVWLEGLGALESKRRFAAIGEIITRHR